MLAAGQWRFVLASLFVLGHVDGHGHLLRAVVRPGGGSAATSCAVNAGQHCESTGTLKMRKSIPRSGNNPPCSNPPGCELGCEGNGNGLGGTGGGPRDPPCPNQGICDHVPREASNP